MDSRKNNISKAILFGVGVGSTIADYKPLYLEYCAIGKNEMLLLGFHGIYLSTACSAHINVLSFDAPPIGHVRYTNVQVLLRGFRVKIANFSIFFCPSIPKRDLDKKKTTPNIEVWGESLGAMLGYWYIERGLFLGSFSIVILSALFSKTICSKTLKYFKMLLNTIENILAFS